MLNFELILDMQKELDSKINNNRERHINDSLISFMAELIEWQETMPLSHKTWVENEYTKAEQLEEYTDMLFFIAQMYNLGEVVIDLETLKKDSYYSLMKNNISVINERVSFHLLMNSAISCMITDVTIHDLLITYLVVAEAMGYTEEEIEEEYKRKHRINLERINKKREEGGWL